MHLRRLAALAALTSLLAVPVALADGGEDDDDDGGGRPVATAKGDITWTVPPDVFGAEVGNVLEFRARKRADGDVSGRIHYEQTFQGETFVFDIDVTCIGLYDGGTRAKIGGVITRSSDATLPPGRFGWFQAFDLGKRKHDPADRSTLLGFGDEAANEAFCNSPNPPRFGPWDVDGQIRIRD